MLRGGEERHEGFGVTSVEQPLPVTPDTRFQIGSISKTFTGTAVMYLVADGVLDLDAVGRYVERQAALPQLTPVGELRSYNNAGFARSPAASWRPSRASGSRAWSSGSPSTRSGSLRARTGRGR